MNDPEQVLAKQETGIFRTKHVVTFDTQILRKIQLGYK